MTATNESVVPPNWKNELIEAAREARALCDAQQAAAEHRDAADINRDVLQAAFDSLQARALRLGYELEWDPSNNDWWLSTFAGSLVIGYGPDTGSGRRDIIAFLDAVDLLRSIPPQIAQFELRHLGDAL